MEQDVGGETYQVYADVETADVYAGAAIHADTWRASVADTKARAVITATRLLDRQRWKGTKADSAQALQWPRSGTSITGVEDDTVPQNIIDASIEIAIALVDGSEVQNDPNTTQKLSALSAGSVSLTFYHGADGTPMRFPQIVNELLRDYLAGGSQAITGVATGVDGESVTRNDFGLTRGL